MSVYRALFTGILIAALAITGWVASRPSGSDEEQILNQIRRAESAIQNQNLSQLLSVISDDYRGAGGTKSELRALTLQTFRDAREIRLAVDEPVIQVSGDSATAKVHVRSRVISHGGADVEYNNTFDIDFQREESRKYLVYPTLEWKVTSANLKMEILDLF